MTHRVGRHVVVILTVQWTYFLAIGGVVVGIDSPIRTNGVTLYEIVVAQIESGGAVGGRFGGDLDGDTSVLAVAFFSIRTIDARPGRTTESLIFVTFINAIAPVDAVVPSFVVFALRDTSIRGYRGVRFPRSTGKGRRHAPIDFVADVSRGAIQTLTVAPILVLEGTRGLTDTVAFGFVVLAMHHTLKLVVEYLSTGAIRTCIRIINVFSIAGAREQGETDVVSVVLGADGAMRTGLGRDVVEIVIIGNVAQVGARVGGGLITLVGGAFGGAPINVIVFGTGRTIAFKGVCIVHGGGDAIDFFFGMIFDVVFGGRMFSGRIHGINVFFDFLGRFFNG